MKLHDLTVGQRFTFTDKHRGKVFEVTDKVNNHGDGYIEYVDTATGQSRTAWSNRVTFRKEVRIETETLLVELTLHEVDMLQWILYGAFTELHPELKLTRSDINKLYLKITGLPGRRVVLPDDVNSSPNGE